MAIPKILEDLNIISKLGDNPLSDNGLSTPQFKARFDAAALAIQNYINNTLIPGIESSVSEDGLLSQIAAQLATKLNLSGGTMTGAINMNGKRLYNVPAPTDNMDAANMSYVDSGVAAAKAYTDSKHLAAIATLSASWSGAAAPYSQIISVSGILATDKPHIVPVYSDTLTTAVAQQEAWAMVSKAVANDGAITFYCFEEKPTTAILVQVEVNR